MLGHAVLAAVSASLEEVAGLSLERSTEAVKCSQRRVLIRGLQAVEGRAAHAKPLRHLDLGESCLFS